MCTEALQLHLGLCIPSPGDATVHVRTLTSDLRLGGNQCFMPSCLRPHLPSAKHELCTVSQHARDHLGLCCRDCPATTIHMQLWLGWDQSKPRQLPQAPVLPPRQVFMLKTHPPVASTQLSGVGTLLTGLKKRTAETGPSSTIFWCRRCTEQSREYREHTLPW